MRWLAIILFAPWFAILIWAYWVFPKNLPRTALRRMFDIVVVIATLAVSVWGMLEYHDANEGFGGAIWKQVAASTAVYIAFLGALLVAYLLRAAIWKRSLPPIEKG
jgi:hypothetical protein